MADKTKPRRPQKLSRCRNPMIDPMIPQTIGVYRRKGVATVKNRNGQLIHPNIMETKSAYRTFRGIGDLGTGLLGAGGQTLL